MTSLRIAVLVPPRETPLRADLEDTFVQAEEILACLRELGHSPILETYRDNGEHLGKLAPDLIVNLVEDVPQGPDHLHLVTAGLDRLGLRYTGAPTEALPVLGDKLAMKARL